MTEELYLLQVICRHGDVKTTIRTDWPNIPVGLAAAHDTGQPKCAPHYVRRLPEADSRTGRQRRMP